MTSLFMEPFSIQTNGDILFKNKDVAYLVSEDGAIKYLQRNARQTGNNIGTGINNTGNNIVTGINNAGNNIGTGINNAGNNIGTGINNAGNDIGTGINNTGDNVDQTIDDTTDDINNTVNDIANDINNTANNTANDINNTANDTANDISDTASNASRKVITTGKIVLYVAVTTLAFIMLVYMIALMTFPTGDITKAALPTSYLHSYGIAGFVLFLLVTTLVLSLNYSTMVENKAIFSSAMVLLICISTIWFLLIGSFWTDGERPPSSPQMAMVNKGIHMLVQILISGILLFWIAYNISTTTTVKSILLHMLLIGLVIGLLYKTFHTYFPVGNGKKDALMRLVVSVFMYIPCLLSGTFDGVARFMVGQYHETTVGSFLMLVAVLALWVMYFSAPYIRNWVTTQGGRVLIHTPVSLDTQQSIGTYQELNHNRDEGYDYQYAISCWFFLDAVPPNTNANYNQYTSILNFGGKPNVLYHAGRNTLMITMKQKNLKELTKNKLTDFDDAGNRILFVERKVLLQKWNNLILNYNGGTMDIFMNGTLVKSLPEVVPYYTYDNLTIGENDGLKGGICNVTYFQKPLTSTKIYYLYHSLKDNTPPL